MAMRDTCDALSEGGCWPRQRRDLTPRSHISMHILLSGAMGGGGTSSANKPSGILNYCGDCLIRNSPAEWFSRKIIKLNHSMSCLLWISQEKLLNLLRKKPNLQILYCAQIRQVTPRSACTFSLRRISGKVFFFNSKNNPSERSMLWPQRKDQDCNLRPVRAKKAATAIKDIPKTRTPDFS